MLRLGDHVTSVEIDVRSTSDGAVVLMHDATVDRSDLLDGQHNIVEVSPAIRPRSEDHEHGDRPEQVV